MFTEIIISDYGYDGVMYTSVQADGQLGFNVAIKPESVNTKMKLILIYETSLYKKGDKAIIVGNKIGSYQSDSTILLETKEETPLDNILEALEIESIKELTDS